MESKRPKSLVSRIEQECGLSRYKARKAVELGKNPHNGVNDIMRKLGLGVDYGKAGYVYDMVRGGLKRVPKPAEQVHNE